MKPRWCEEARGAALAFEYSVDVLFAVGDIVCSNTECWLDLLRSVALNHSPNILCSVGATVCSQIRSIPFSVLEQASLSRTPSSLENKFTHWLNWGGEVKYWPVALRSDLVRTRSSRTGGRLQRGRDLKMGRFHLKNPLRSILRFSKQGTVWRTFSSISSHGSRSICWSRLVPVKLCQCFIWECHWTTERQSCAVVPRNLCKVFTGQNSSGMRSKLKCCGSAVLKVPKCWGLSSSWSSSE